MKLPNGGKAVVDITKLRDYCLNQNHPEGRHKARIFRLALGMGTEDAQRLRAALLAAARNQDAEPAESDQYGERFVLNFRLKHLRREAWVRAAWIIRKDEDFPRLISCYVLRGLK
jgi:hypothetical protein